MADKEAPATQAGSQSQSSSQRHAQAQPSAEGNCVGKLEQLPDVEGTAYHEYRCKSCGQVVHVGLEHLEVYGLPPEHHRREEEK